ncbi:uncharacterized protein LOC131036819 [Cryptomeria japonica]|uniref:uncharacterized protein LOC131036819 n=1 Tax=Cryptomeria japonica TaxID=3369 RepID=UPI0025AC402A|nr:uncharacterized protein LOC131036819 [Cryptomeria japonica]XP_057824789.1 uncharacterized protein LOC131036819 [Cryptomeria japonica]
MALSPPAKTSKVSALSKSKQGHSSPSGSVKRKLSLPKERRSISKENENGDCKQPVMKENENGDSEQQVIKEKGGASKRTKCPGVRVIGGRVYDSENGKTCHQCRQKTLEFMASCRNVKGGKTCTMNFCPKCLLNRYGEKVEEASKSEEWKCPRCRGICNCSICMKKQGCVPTGILSHAAKATGFASVSDLLQCEGLTLDQVDALNSSQLDGLFESICSGAMDVKDLAKKLKPVQGSLISKQPTDMSLKKQCIPSLIHLLKDEKIKKLFNKCSSPSKEGNVQKSFDQSPAPLDLNGISCSEETANLSKSSKKIKRERGVEVKMIVNEEKLGIDKNVDKASDVSSSGNGAVTTKKKSKTKKNGKIKEEKKDLKDIQGPKGGNDSDVLSRPTISEPSNPKIKGQVMTGSKDDKEIEDSTDITEPVQRQKQTQLKRKQKKVHPSEISTSTGNEATAESNHGPDAAERKSKKQKSGSTISIENKNTVKGSEGQTITVTHRNKKIAEKDLNMKKHGIPKEENVPIISPQGKLMSSVAGIELSAGDVGQALQFLEFCSAFEQVLDLKKGLPESILRELTRGRVSQRGMYSSIVQFHVKLLSLIGEDMGEECEISHSGSGGNSWVQALRRLVTKKSSLLKEDAQPMSCNSSSDEQQRLRQEICQFDSFANASLRGGVEGYEMLDLSRKLRLLNILCDESLNTRCLRDWIDSANSRFNEYKKEHQEELMAVKEKAKEARQRMKDEMARVLLSSKEGSTLTINEHDELISRVKLEAEKARAAKQDALEATSRMKRPRCDAIRTQPIALDENGRAYWRLKGESDRSVCLLQDVSSWESLIGHDQWFLYNEEEENILVKYISWTRALKARQHQQCRVSPQSCSKIMDSEPVCAIEIALD